MTRTAADMDHGHDTHHQETNTRHRQAAGDDGAELVERARAGDHEAFGRLYTRHHASVYRLARMRLGHQAAEDAVAETFLRAWVGLPRYKVTGAPFVAWLYGICRHVVSDTAAAARRAEPREDPAPGAAVDDRERRDAHLVLAEALGRLPKEQRQVIELKYLAGLNNDDVAAVLGKSPGAVNAQQWRALRSLRRTLEES